MVVIITPTKRQRDLLHYCFSLALKSTVSNGRHGAIVTNQEGKVLSTGYNHSWTHAECDALNNLDFDKIKGLLILYVVRGRMLGDLTLSKPCENCMQFIRQFPVSKIVYSDKDLVVLHHL